MDRFTNWAIGLFIVAFFIGCGHVKFNRNNDFNRCQNFNQDCVQTDDADVFDYSITVGQGLVDILFVDDNSGSMSTEQRGMSNAFATFVSSLGDLDYRIAITTTDVGSAANPPSPYNGQGAYQNGNLIDFPSGLKFIERTTSNAQSMFQAKIQRLETLQCEQSGFAHCPSGDERGILAATMAVQNNQGGFLRPNASLAVVILSDEDVRSTGFLNPTRGYEPTDEDRAENFLSLFQGSTSPYRDKTVRVHSIIVKPGDTNCKSIQDRQTTNAPGPVNGNYGYEYARLAQMTNGVVGDICAGGSIANPYATPDYTAQVGQIAYSIRDIVKNPKIACRPMNDQVIVTLTPANPSITATLEPISETVVFSQQLPPGTKARFQYSCARL